MHRQLRCNERKAFKLPRTMHCCLHPPHTAAPGALALVLTLFLVSLSAVLRSSAPWPAAHTHDHTAASAASLHFHTHVHSRLRLSGSSTFAGFLFAPCTLPVRSSRPCGPCSRPASCPGSSRPCPTPAAAVQSRGWAALPGALPAGLPGRRRTAAARGT